MDPAIANLTNSCMSTTVDRVIPGGVYLRVRIGCTPNCSARRNM
jgi:hypothetical protein